MTEDSQDPSDMRPMTCTTCRHVCNDRADSMIHTLTTGHTRFSQRAHAAEALEAQLAEALDALLQSVHGRAPDSPRVGHMLCDQLPSDLETQGSDDDLMLAMAISASLAESAPTQLDARTRPTSEQQRRRARALAAAEARSSGLGMPPGRRAGALAAAEPRPLSQMNRTAEDTALPECAVCLEHLVGCATRPVRALRCGHCFHTGCVDQWLRGNPGCPLCRVHTGA